MVGRTCVGVLGTGFEGPEITESVYIYGHSLNPHFQDAPLPPPSAGPSVPNTKPLAKPLWAVTHPSSAGQRGEGVSAPSTEFHPLLSAPTVFRTYGPRVWSFSDILGTSWLASRWLLTI